MTAIVKATLKATTLVDAVYDALRDRVLTGEIPGGAPLTELGVAGSYDVARPTAKAALERLVQHGLLRRGPNKSARVPRLTVDDVRDLYRCRTILEREVMATLARTKQVPPAARSALRTFRQAVDDPSLTGVVEADVAFHRALVEAIGSPRVTRMYASVIGEAHLCMAQVQVHRLLPPRTIEREHKRILDAIASGDPDLAADRLAEHLDRACRRLVDHLQGGA